MIDGMVYDGLWETFYNYHMGLTSENIAEKFGITREEQDKLALMSNQRALAAIRDGIFEQEIVPVEVREKKAVKLFDTDEHPRETSMEALAKLPPGIQKGWVGNGRQCLGDNRCRYCSGGNVGGKGKGAGLKANGNY